MNTCESVLLATDLSNACDSAINVAARLADIYRAKLHLVHIFQYVPQHHYPFYISWMVEDVQHKIRDRLASIREQLEAQGRSVEIKVIEDGDPAREILQYAGGLAAPVIVSGTHSSAGLERFILGSVAENIRRHAVCPVMTVRPEILSPPHNRYSQIMVALGDGAQPRVLAHAPSLLDPTIGRFELVHVIGPNDEADPAEQFKAARKALVSNGVHPSVIAEQVLHGAHVAQAIVNEAERSGTDLIIMGSKAALEAATHLPPGIGTQIVSAAPCPVLSIPV